nr:uncharacterized protein LOC112427080 [Macaca nemestrina]
MKSSPPPDRQRSLPSVLSLAGAQPRWEGRCHVESRLLHISRLSSCCPWGHPLLLAVLGHSLAHARAHVQVVKPAQDSLLQATLPLIHPPNKSEQHLRDRNLTRRPDSRAGPHPLLPVPAWSRRNQIHSRRGCVHAGSTRTSLPVHAGSTRTSSPVHAKVHTHIIARPRQVHTHIIACPRKVLFTSGLCPFGVHTHIIACPHQVHTHVIAHPRKVLFTSGLCPRGVHTHITHPRESCSRWGCVHISCALLPAMHKAPWQEALPTHR